MKRRDFLRLRTERGLRTFELSCQQLHLHYLERRATRGQLDTGGPLGTGGPLDGNFGAEEGEPPAAFEERTTEQLFANLERDMHGAELLRVTGHRWLSEGDEELRQEFNRLVSAFRARGGRVEFG